MDVPNPTVDSAHTSLWEEELAQSLERKTVTHPGGIIDPNDSGSVRDQERVVFDTETVVDSFLQRKLGIRGPVQPDDAGLGNLLACPLDRLDEVCPAGGQG